MDITPAQATAIFRCAEIRLNCSISREEWDAGQLQELLIPDDYLAPSLVSISVHSLIINMFIGMIYILCELMH